MSRDRLAAIRSQKQEQEFNSQPSYNSGNDDPYQNYSSPSQPRNLTNNGGGLPSGPRGGTRRPSQDNYNDSGNQYPPTSNRPSRQKETMEMREVNGGGGRVGRDSTIMGGGGIEAFFEEISSLQTQIRDLQNTIQSVDSIQTQLSSLPVSSEPSREQTRLTEQLERDSSNIRSSTTKVKNAIVRLVEDTKKMAKTPGAITQEDVDLRTNQIKTLQKRFVGVVEEYAAIEKKGRDATKKKLERQVLIVNPNLSDYEVKQVVDDAISGQNEGGIFSQALSSQRLGQANSTLSEVRSRQEDIKRIETTLIELADLFNEMSIMIEQQDFQIRAIEQQVENVGVDMEKGLQELGKAKVSARNARRMRVWCFFIFVVVLLVVGGIVAFEILKHKNDSSDSPSSDSSSSSTSSSSGSSPDPSLGSGTRFRFVVRARAYE